MIGINSGHGDQRYFRDDLTEATDAVDPHAAAEAGALQRAIAEALEELTPREQRILRMRFGIGSTTDHTLEEVGKVFGVCGR